MSDGPRTNPAGRTCQATLLLLPLWPFWVARYWIKKGLTNDAFQRILARLEGKS